MHCPFLRRQRPRRMGNKIKVVKLPFEIVFTHHLLYTYCIGDRLYLVFFLPHDTMWSLSNRLPHVQWLCLNRCNGPNWSPDFLATYAQLTSQVSLESNAKWNQSGPDQLFRILHGHFESVNPRCGCWNWKNVKSTYPTSGALKTNERSCNSCGFHVATKKEKEVRLHQDTTVDILVTLIFHDQCFQLLSIPRCRGHPKILLWMVYNTAPAPVLSIGSLVFRAQKLIHGDIYIYIWIVYGYPYIII